MDDNPYHLKTISPNEFFYEIEVSHHREDSFWRENSKALGAITTPFSLCAVAFAVQQFESYQPK